MPEVLSVALGGGTKVETRDGKVHVGPESVGHRLLSEGLVFGGKTLTTTGKTDNLLGVRFADKDIQTSSLQVAMQILATRPRSSTFHTIQ
jgi:N-methylhydantoinase A/oxoprolinase/acetone carboxylase beta subunit